jgi:hypothetical protein
MSKRAIFVIAFSLMLNAILAFTFRNELVQSAERFVNSLYTVTYTIKGGGPRELISDTKVDRMVREIEQFYVDGNQIVVKMESDVPDFLRTKFERKLDDKRIVYKKIGF